MSSIKHSNRIVPCPQCGSGVNAVRYFMADANVRGTHLQVEKNLRRCEICRCEFESSLDADWRIDAYAKYREIHSFVTPEALREWRAYNDLSQLDVAALLGFGENTIGRYEAGALQTEANNAALRRIMTPQGLLDAISAHPEALPADKRTVIQCTYAAASAQAAANTLLMASVEKDNLIYTGCRQPSFGRIAAFVSTLACEQINKTVLNKLMFYSDFLSFRDYGKSISGLAYARLPYGPVPHNYDTIFGVLSAVKVIEVTPVKMGNCVADTVRAIEPNFVVPDIEDSKELMRLVKEKFRGYTSKRISEFSHRERAWLDVEPCNLIPYDMAEHINVSIPLHKRAKTLKEPNDRRILRKM